MNRGLTIFVFILLILPVVFAFDITVKTNANRNILVNVLEPTSGVGITSFNNFSFDGLLTQTVYVNQTVVDLYAIIRYPNNSVEVRDKFTGISTDSPITINLVKVEQKPEDIVNVTTETISDTNVSQNTDLAAAETQINKSQQNTANEQTTNQESANVSAGISGFSIFEDIGGVFNPSMIYYIVGGVVVLVILFFGYRYRGSFKKMFKKEADYFPKFSSSSGDHEHLDNDRMLLAAEHKLRAAQLEIEKVKKIRDAERRVEEARRELERMKRGL